MPPRDSDLDYWVCPNCGADLDRDAAFCRECGASDESGWNEADAWADPDLDDLDGPSDPDFEYEAFIAREFPDQPGRGGDRWSVKWFLATVVVVLLIALLLLGTVF